MTVHLMTPVFCTLVPVDATSHAAEVALLMTMLTPPLSHVHEYVNGPTPPVTLELIAKLWVPLAAFAK